MFNLAPWWNDTVFEQMVSRALRAGKEGLTHIFSFFFGTTAELHKNLTVLAKTKERQIYLERGLKGDNFLHAVQEFIIKSNIEAKFNKHITAELLQDQVNKAEEKFRALLNPAIEKLKKELKDPSSSFAKEMEKARQIEIVDPNLRQTPSQPVPSLAENLSQRSVLPPSQEKAVGNQQPMFDFTPRHVSHQSSITNANQHLSKTPKPIDLSKTLTLNPFDLKLKLTLGLIPLPIHDEKTAIQLAYQLKNAGELNAKLLQSATMLTEGDWKEMQNNPKQFFSQTSIEPFKMVHGYLKGCEQAKQYAKEQVYAGLKKQSKGAHLMLKEEPRQMILRLLVYGA